MTKKYTSNMESDQKTEERVQVEGQVIDGNSIKVRKEKCSIGPIGDRKGDNDYLNNEKYGNKMNKVAVACYIKV